MSSTQYYVPILRKYVPNLPMDYEAIGSHEKRLKLADVFDKAVGIPIVVEPEARRVWPPNRDEKPKTRPNTEEPRDDGSRTNASAAVTAMLRGDVPSSFSKKFVIGAAVATVLAGIAGWLALRSRQGKR